MRRLYQSLEDKANSQHYTTPIVPHENDILLGRGGNNNQHTGNQKLRELARVYSYNYQISSKKGKANLARELVKQIHILTPPGRFLKKTRGVWEEVNDEYAKEKASQVLRDAVAGIKSYQKVDSTHDVDYQNKEQTSTYASTVLKPKASNLDGAKPRSQETIGNARRAISAPPSAQKRPRRWAEANFITPPFQNPVKSPSVMADRRLSSMSAEPPERHKHQMDPSLHHLSVNHMPFPGRYSFHAHQRQSLPPVPTSPLIPTQVTFDEPTSPPGSMTSAPFLGVSPNSNSQRNMQNRLDPIDLLNSELINSDDEFSS